MKYCLNLKDLFLSEVSFQVSVGSPHGGGGLPYETDRDARRLAEGCKDRMFGLAKRVSGKTSIF